MGLDIYVGPLCRYYARDWETVVQKAGRAMGINVEIRRTDDSGDAITDPAEALVLVEDWRAGLAEAMRGEGVSPSWQEDTKGDYFTDKPAWDCYADLLLWAAYLEHPELRRPWTPVENWHDDPALVSSREKTFRTRFPHLLLETEFWLPADFDFTFGASTPIGDEVTFGSCVHLRNELAAINRESWNGSPADLAAWRLANSDHGAPLEHGARFCCALMLALAEVAVEKCLPMKLDY